MILSAPERGIEARNSKPSAGPVINSSRLFLSQRRGQYRRAQFKVTALHIDRRAHLERAWQKQKELEEKLVVVTRPASSPLPVEVACLAHLERYVEIAGSSIIVVAFYSRSCGACKQMLQHYTEICQEACSQRAGVKFLKHNVRDEFDDITDIARLYRIKNVPCFVFISGGAMMKSMPMPDSRIDPSSIRKLMGSQAGHLSAALRQMLFKDTPSARR